MPDPSASPDRSTQGVIGTCRILEESLSSIGFRCADPSIAKLRKQLQELPNSPASDLYPHLIAQTFREMLDAVHDSGDPRFTAGVLPAGNGKLTSFASRLESAAERFQNEAAFEKGI